ncbi:MAG: hypothetical protein MUF02_10285 [Acidobacteria bacterium]|nr:hypothetical protein [Acidobacteriota bacterium]
MFLNLAPMEGDLDLEILLNAVAIVDQVYLVERADDRLKIADQIDAVGADIVGHKADHVEQLAFHVLGSVDARAFSLFHGCPSSVLKDQCITNGKYFNRRRQRDLLLNS